PRPAAGTLQRTPWENLAHRGTSFCPGWLGGPDFQVAPPVTGCLGSAAVAVRPQRDEIEPIAPSTLRRNESLAGDLLEEHAIQPHLEPAGRVALAGRELDVAPVDVPLPTVERRPGYERSEPLLPVAVAQPAFEAYA